MGLWLNGSPCPRRSEDLSPTGFGPLPGSPGKRGSPRAALGPVSLVPEDRGDHPQGWGRHRCFGRAWPGSRWGCLGQPFRPPCARDVLGTLLSSKPQASSILRLGWPSQQAPPKDLPLPGLWLTSWESRDGPSCPEGEQGALLPPQMLRFRSSRPDSASGLGLPTRFGTAWASPLCSLPPTPPPGGLLARRLVSTQPYRSLPQPPPPCCLTNL